MQHEITMLVSPIPGIRLVEGKDSEDGSMIALRKSGDEILFASWETESPESDRGRGMTWIPVGEFSPDPESIRPPEILEETGEEEAEEQADGTKEKPGNPFGGQRGLRKRPGL